MLVFGETRFVKFCYWLIDLCSHTEIMATIDGKNKLLSLLWGLDSVFLFCCFLWPLFLTNISKIANQKLQDIDARLLHKWGHLPSAFPVLIRLKDLKKVDRKKKNLLLTFSYWCKTCTENWLVVFCSTKGIFKLLFCYSSWAIFSCSLACVIRCFIR